MRVIPIAPEALDRPDANACGDDLGESGGLPRPVLPLARREFLKGSGVLMGTLAAGTTLAGLAPSTVWALELKRLSQSEGQALMAMGRVLYPHKKLPDAVYALLVKDLDAKADSLTLLRVGLSELDRAAGGPFVKASAATKLKAVTALEGTPFFNTVRGQCVTSLYDNDMAFAVFGYPGSSWDKGGYLTRGFQDLKWLPAPPAEASPSPFVR